MEKYKLKKYLHKLRNVGNIDSKLHGAKKQVYMTKINNYTNMLNIKNGGNGDDDDDLTINPTIMPIPWWVGFSVSHQDGKLGNEGIIMHILVELLSINPNLTTLNWKSNNSLSKWDFVTYEVDVETNEVLSFKVTINNTGLEILPESFGRLISLTELHLYNTKLTSLPESFGDLVSLTKLYIDHSNKLTSLPESFGRLRSLTELYLYNTKLTSLPESFGDLVSLTKLYIDYSNKLTSLPESFGRLRSLTELHLCNTKLTSLPESFGDLVSLTKLYMYNNTMLASLPESFDRLRSSVELYIDPKYNIPDY